MTLTGAQMEAIRRSGQDVCVVAGPGSGKTTVLIERFAWLVEEQIVDPARILAITFTEKAATEIKERLIARFHSRPDLRAAIEHAWVATIHGFCARLLRENAIAAGLAPDFTVLDQPAAERMARESAEEALEQMFEERPAEMRRVFEALDLSTDDLGRNPDIARSLLAVYESMRVAGLRELPEAKIRDDVWSRARELAAIALEDRSAKGAHIPLLREFAARLLALPDDINLEHFAAIESVEFHRNRIAKGTRAHAAAEELKTKLVPALKQQWVAIWHAGSAGVLREAISRIDALYRERKRREAAIDFAGLEEETIRLLELNPGLRERTAARFDQILMDELQDTNPLQWRLIQLIRRGFFAVGDINQSIYGFRYAEPAVFADYRAGLVSCGATIDELRENHRSVRDVLNCVARVLNGQAGIETRPLIPSRTEGDGSSVELLVGHGDDAEEVEASMVAARIIELRGDGVPFHDIAILVRTLGAARAFESALDRFEIPFLVSGGRTFLEAREIRDVLALLAALTNPLDEIALVGVLRSPLIGMGDQEIFRMGAEGWRAEFHERFGKFRPMAGFVPPDLLLARALDECGYASRLPERARANIEKLFAYIRGEHRKRPRALAELLEDLEALRATQSQAEAPPPEAGNVVRIMTIHAAKGLEFPVVFVSALHRQTDSTKPVIVFSPAAGLGAKWRNPVTGKGQADGAHQQIVEEMKAKETAEENRLLYVAMTRAKDRLILSYAEKKRAANWPALVASKIAPVRIAEQIAAPKEAGANTMGAARTGDQLLDPPGFVTNRDGAAAVTSIALFHACPRKFLLSSISARGRAGGDFTQGEGGLEFGTTVHAILAGETPEASGVAGELAAKFHASELGLRAARANRIEREFDFLFYFEDVVLRGQIDLWFEESGELIVVDYKTDQTESADAYALQLQVYALALEKYAGRVADRAVLFFLRSGTAIDVAIDEMEARAAVRAFLDAQDSLKYPMNAGWQCRRCAFFGRECAGTGAAAAG